jgi:hypothetical protein
MDTKGCAGRVKVDLFFQRSHKEETVTARLLNFAIPGNPNQREETRRIGKFQGGTD